MVTAGPSSPRALGHRGTGLALLLGVAAVLLLSAAAAGTIRTLGDPGAPRAWAHPSIGSTAGPRAMVVPPPERTSPAQPLGASPSILTAATIDLVGDGVLSGTASLRYVNGADGVAFDAHEDLVFVAGGQSDSIAAIDPSTGIEQTASGPLYTGNTTANPSPGSLAFDATDNQLFASDPTADSVDVYNVSSSGPSFSYYGSVPLAAGANPSAMIWVNATDYVYVAEKGLDQVVGIAGGTDTFAGVATVGAAPVALTYDPLHGLVFAADSASADTAWFTATSFVEGPSNFPVHNNPTSIAYNPDDDTVWVGSAASISIVDAATRNSSVNLTFPSSTHISGLLWGTVSKDMVVANEPSGIVSFFGPADTVVGNVTTGGTPAIIVENTVDSELETIDLSTNNLLRISELSQSLVGTEEIGVAPGISSFNPVTERLEVPDVTSDRIVEINTGTVSPGDRPVVRADMVPGHPVATTFDPVAGLVVVALAGGTVVGLNATSGAVLRTTNLGSSYTLYDVLYADDQVFVTGGANLMWSLNPATLTTGPIIQLDLLALRAADDRLLASKAAPLREPPHR